MNLFSFALIKLKLKKIEKNITIKIIHFIFFRKGVLKLYLNF